MLAEPAQILSYNSLFFYNSLFSCNSLIHDPGLRIWKNVPSLMLESALKKDTYIARTFQFIHVAPPSLFSPNSKRSCDIRYIIYHPIFLQLGQLRLWDKTAFRETINLINLVGKWKLFFSQWAPRLKILEGRKNILQ